MNERNSFKINSNLAIIEEGRFTETDGDFVKPNFQICNKSEKRGFMNLIFPPNNIETSGTRPGSNISPINFSKYTE